MLKKKNMTCVKQQLCLHVILEPALFFVFNTDDLNFVPLQPLNMENDKISLECQYCKKQVTPSLRLTKKRRLCSRRRRMKKKREKNTAQDWTLYETDSSGSTFYETDISGTKKKLCGRRLRHLKKKKKFALLDQYSSGRPYTMYKTYTNVHAMLYQINSKQKTWNKTKR